MQNSLKSMCIRSQILTGALFILILLPCIKGNAQEPTPSWIRDIKGGSEWPFYLNVDEYDNTYLIGRYYQDFTFQGNHYMPEFQGNTFLVKISPAGELLWYKSLEIGNDYSSIFGVVDLKTDLNNDLILCGVFADSLSLIDTTFYNHSYNKTSYILKFDPEGNRKDFFLTPSYDEIIDIEIDLNNNIYLVGEYFTILKLNENLDTIWSLDDYSFQGDLRDIFAVATDHQGMVYIFAEFRDYFVFEGDTVFADGKQHLLASLSPDGELLWMKEVTSEYSVLGRYFHLEGLSAGFAFSGEIPEKPLYYNGDSIYSMQGYQYTGFVAFLTSDGTISWLKKIGSNYRGYGNRPKLHSPNGEEIIVYDSYQGDIHIDDTIIAGNGKIYVTKFDQEGNRLWSVNDGGIISTRIEIYDLATTFEENIVFIGHYCGLINLNDTLLYSNDNDIYAACLNPSTWQNTYGTGKNPEISGIDFYPNPARERISVSVTSSSGYEILDLTGNPVQNGSLVKGNNVVFLSGLTPGIYFLRIMKENPVSFKFVKL